MGFEERGHLARKLKSLKESLALEVTEEFLRRHPDWVERYGERARTYGVEDATFHIDYLAGAVASGSVTSFEEYARWVAGVLSSRGIATGFLWENLRQVDQALLARLEPRESAVVHELVERACCSGPEAPTERPSDPRLAQTRSDYLRAILEGRRQDAVTIALAAVDAGHAIEDIYVEILQDSQYALGTLWASNNITVAEEHIATAITQFVMANIYPHIPLASQPVGSILITGVEGELHQVGVNMVADVLETKGWDVRFLGTNLPNSSILAALREFKPDLLGVSVTLLPRVDKAAELLAQVREHLGDQSPRVILGGAAFRQTPDYVRELGAQGSAADLREAVALAQALRP